MQLEYFPCYHSYFKKCEKLTDQELGRLFRALMTYSETGERQELAGRESIAFDFIADDIDRAKENYADICKTRSEQGKKGAEKRWSENSKNSNCHFSYEENGKHGQNKNKSENKINIKENVPKGTSKKSADALTPFSEFSPELQEALQEWMQYKAERKEQYKPTGLKAFVSEVRNKLRTYGEAMVISLIRECMANGWRGIIWDRLEKQKPPDKLKGGYGGRDNVHGTSEISAKAPDKKDWNLTGNYL